MNKRKKATDIKPEVKKRVEERDGWCCIFCRAFGESGFEPTDHAHYIGRAQGGLGIEENIVYACVAHHHEMDNGKDMKKYRDFCREYLSDHYMGWNEQDLKYNKWAGFAIS